MRDPFGYSSWYRVAPRDVRGCAKLGEGIRVLPSFRHSSDALGVSHSAGERYVWSEAKRHAPDAPMRGTVPYSRTVNIVADGQTVTRMEWTQGALRASERRSRNRARRKGRTLVARY